MAKDKNRSDSEYRDQPEDTTARDNVQPSESETPEAAKDSSRSNNDCRRGKLHSFDWLADIPGDKAASDIVEVQFKNTRKGYYRNTTNLPLGTGDLVAVEAVPGHDIGTVTLTGALAELRMKRSAGRNTPEPKRDIPPRQACRHREIRGGKGSRGRYHDTRPQDSRKPRPQHEDWRRRVPGRRQ